MKSRSLLIPAILAATAAFGVASSAFSEPRDAQAQAAALLSGERIAAVVEPTVVEPTGDHPAVIVARQWSTRGIDPNQFIVGHPAGVRLIATPPSGENEALVRVDTAVTIF
jgi:hypothetical protein